MFEVQIYIPEASNEGRVVLPETHAAFEETLADYFEAFTRLPAKVTGTWKMEDGRVIREEHRVYVIGVETIRAGAHAWTVAQKARAHYGQEAIYISYLGQGEAVR